MEKGYTSICFYIFSIFPKVAGYILPTNTIISRRARICGERVQVRHKILTYYSCLYVVYIIEQNKICRSCWVTTRSVVVVSARPRLVSFCGFFVSLVDEVSALFGQSWSEQLRVNGGEISPSLLRTSVIYTGVLGTYNTTALYDTYRYTIIYSLPRHRRGGNATIKKLIMRT